MADDRARLGPGSAFRALPWRPMREPYPRALLQPRRLRARPHPPHPAPRVRTGPPAAGNHAPRRQRVAPCRRAGHRRPHPRSRRRADTGCRPEPPLRRPRGRPRARVAVDGRPADAGGDPRGGRARVRAAPGPRRSVPGRVPARTGGRDRRLVLGLRDIPDEPWTPRATWDRDDAHDLLDRAYDRILVYGDPRVYDLPAAYGFPDEARRKRSTAATSPRPRRRFRSPRFERGWGSVRNRRP